MKILYLLTLFIFSGDGPPSQVIEVGYYDTMKECAEASWEFIQPYVTASCKKVEMGLEI